MELSSPEAETDQAGASRRKSGRVVKAPENLISSSKRKRTQVDGEDLDIEDASEESEVSDDGEPDEEELKEKKKRANARKPHKKTPATAANKPAAKKAKQTNGDAVRLAIRSAAPKKPRAKSSKLQHKVADAEAVGGLYGE